MHLYRATIFLSAFLLFVVQPIITKYFLPWFGGSASVWATALLFFTSFLLFGYLYAHGLSRFSLRAQVLIHLVVLLIGVVLLVWLWRAWGTPLTPSQEFVPDPSSNPSFALLVRLGLVVGLPYFLLATTSPLLQAWFHKTGRGIPYGLYALSNVGSLGALFAYPFLIEPLVSIKTQALIWGGLFIVFSVLLLFVAFGVLNSRASIHTPAKKHTPSKHRGAWLLLATIPAVLLVASTNTLTQGVASVPFLWVFPLAIYLSTFAFAFSKYNLPQPFVLTGTVGFSLFALVMIGTNRFVPLLLEMVFLLAFLFFACLFFHSWLYRLRPDGDDLTRYYVMIALGGALGTFFVSIVAPLVFTRPIEMFLAVILTFLVSFWVYFRNAFVFAQNSKLDILLVGLVGIALVCFLLLFFMVGRSGIIFEDRNFYGSLLVREVTDDKGSMRLLKNGRILHGAQFQDEQRSLIPTTYYTQQSGIGRVLSRESDTPRRVALVGLGAGTLSAYCRDGDLFRFFEIDPQVHRVAGEQFSFLDSCDGTEVVYGDARLSLGREDPTDLPYDVIVLDAFTDDAIPVHLLTREAFSLYLSRLTEDGILAVHISNRYLNLAPVLSGASAVYELSGRVVSDKGGEQSEMSTWVLLARDGSALPVVDDESVTELSKEKIVEWTDDYSHLFSVIHL